ncbi:unnamed protein product [Rotaria sp. Silwood1]|nr:unnamed protein product [Rotaria sp. Silwood1]CAF3746320.1 unnamed protein product [Rotaria sp. Silwood1]CAF4814037.1 unnamed protein product [Rotaria sp. Silwood1]
MMGSCTSTTKRRQKDHQQLHKRIELKNSVALDNKDIASLQSPPFLNQQSQRPHSLLSNINVQSSPLQESICHSINTNSLIQLYTPNMNNNNNYNRHSWIPSSSVTSHNPTRIPISKNRLSLHQPQSSSISSVQFRNVTATFTTPNQTGSSLPMSITNRASTHVSSTQNNTQSRFGFIPRPIAPGLQQPQASSSLINRSRSISPSSSSISGNSSSTNASQRLTKNQVIPKATSNRSNTSSSNATHVSKSKTFSSSRNNNNNKESPTSKLTTTNRLHTNIPSPNSTTTPSVSISPVQSTKTNVNIIRDRYKNQKRMNFYSRRTSMPNSLKNPSVIKEEKNEQIINISNENQTDDLKTESSQQISSSHGDSAYASITLPLNRVPSVQYSQINRQQRRTSSTLSSSSNVSDVLNHDAFLDDDNCSLKSDDLICDYDDTLTLESASKNDQTDSLSSTSLSIETNKKPSMITSTTIIKPNIPLFQNVSKENRSSSIVKCSTTDKINANLRESLDELTELSNRMDNIVDSEHNRRLQTRSLSLKPPTTTLPPREDAEQIIMDIESYRQVMKDVTVVKTILHQLDRLLKHSDGTNMTDSMIGSFHESMISSRHYSISAGGGDSNLRNTIDENSSYDDLVKEIIILRKEREQDKQTIKLLQDQMYKYSSQTNV